MLLRNFGGLVVQFDLHVLVEGDREVIFFFWRRKRRRSEKKEMEKKGRRGRGGRRFSKGECGLLGHFRTRTRDSFIDFIYIFFVHFIAYRLCDDDDDDTNQSELRNPHHRNTAFPIHNSTFTTKIIHLPNTLHGLAIDRELYTYSRSRACFNTGNPSKSE